MRAAIATAFLLVASAAEGRVAFHYATPLTPRQLAWYSRFEVLVTHDPLPATQVAALHAKGTKLVLYEWSVAFYGSLATPWQKRLLADRRGLLNTRPLRGGAGAADADAYYYDPASREHTEERAALLARKIRALGYDGVFLDTTTFENVHPQAQAEYRLRHPGLDYDAAFARFMQALRRELKVVITNQGYRAADALLPFVDYDVTESLITQPVNGKYVIRPRLALFKSVRKKHPRVRFVHLNYVDALTADAVKRIVRIARQTGDDAYVTVPSLDREGSAGALP